VTSYTKDNDYTLRVQDDYSSKDHYFRGLTRVFNFKAAQVTTIYNEWIAGSAGNTVTSQMHVQNFDEIQSQSEIREMRDKLVELGGSPPPLEELTGLKKPKLNP